MVAVTGRRITTQEAHIRTATVEVRVLTISGKQVTLAVFRQLPYGNIIDDATFQLRGVPWGRVNYHTKTCDSDEHMHIVWQDGDELRHAEVSYGRRERYASLRPFWTKVQEAARMAICWRTMEAADHESTPWPPYTRDKDALGRFTGEVTIVSQGVLVPVDIPMAVLALLEQAYVAEPSAPDPEAIDEGEEAAADRVAAASEARRKNGDLRGYLRRPETAGSRNEQKRYAYESQQYARADFVKRRDEARTCLDAWAKRGWTDSQVSEQSLEKRLVAWREAEGRWDALIKDLEALDQLFIAV